MKKNIFKENKREENKIREVTNLKNVPNKYEAYRSMSTEETTSTKREKSILFFG